MSRNEITYHEVPNHYNNSKNSYQRKNPGETGYEYQIDSWHTKLTIRDETLNNRPFVPDRVVSFVHY